jgi:cobalt/nickel transport protein
MSADQHSRETSADRSPTQPHAEESRTRGSVRIRTLVLVGVLVSLVLAGFVSFYASSRPDGLEFVAGEQGFLDSAGDHASADSPFADYATRGIDDARLSGGLAGVVGVLVVGALAFVLFRVLAGRRSHR